MSKIRLDQYLCQNGLVQSRERAKALIMSGIVFVNEQKVDKAGEMIAPDAKVDRKSTRLNSSHWNKSRMPSSA